MLETSDKEFTGLLDKYGNEILENDYITITFGKEDKAKGINRYAYENVRVIWHTGRLQWMVASEQLLNGYASLGPECYVNPEYEKTHPRRQA